MAALTGGLEDETTALQTQALFQLLAGLLIDATRFLEVMAEGKVIKK